MPIINPALAFARDEAFLFCFGVFPHRILDTKYPCGASIITKTRT